MKAKRDIQTGLEKLAKEFFVMPDDTNYDGHDWKVYHNRQIDLIKLLCSDIGDKIQIEDAKIELMSREIDLGEYQSQPGEAVIRFTKNGSTGFLRILDNTSSWTQDGTLGEEFYNDYFVEVLPVEKLVTVFEVI